jgi:hypothetical protein
MKATKNQLITLERGYTIVITLLENKVTLPKHTDVQIFYKNQQCQLKYFDFTQQYTGSMGRLHFFFQNLIDGE